MDVAEHAGHAGNRQRYLAAEQIAGCLTAAAIGHVIELDAGHRAKHRGKQMLAAAVARRGVIDLPRPDLGVGDQFLQRLYRQRGIDDDDARFAPDQRDRREVLDRIEREARIQRCTDRIGLRGKQQRIAVGGRLGDQLAADRRARARLVLDENRLAEAPGQLLRDQTHRPVDRAARGEGHDHPHRPRRIVVRCRGRQDSEREQHEQRATADRSSRRRVTPRASAKSRDQDGSGMRCSHAAFLQLFAVRQRVRARNTSRAVRRPAGGRAPQPPRRAVPAHARRARLRRLRGRASPMTARRPSAGSARRTFARCSS